MPWNDQSNGPGRPSGGPWGDGPKNPNPWGQPPRPPGGGGGQQGGDLEDMLRRMQERMRGSLGNRRGGGGPSFKLGGPRGLMVAGGALLLLWAASGIYTVGAGQAGVVQTLGAYTRTSGPGLHVHVPWPFESVRVVDVTQQRRVLVGEGPDGRDIPGQSLMLTGDESIVDVDFVVVWSLSDAVDFVYSLRDPEAAVAAVAESAMREVIGQRRLEAIITTERAQVEEATRQLMQATLDQYQAGVQVNQVQLQSAAAPPEVREAFLDVVRAGQDAETKINEANTYRNRVVPQARGEAAQMLQQAEAYREQVVRNAAGEAERFRLIYEQYRQNPRVTRDRLYLETMERVLGRADKIIVDQRTGVTPYLPLDRLRRPAQSAGGQAGASAAPQGGTP